MRWRTMLYEHISGCLSYVFLKENYVIVEDSKKLKTSLDSRQPLEELATMTKTRRTATTSPKV